MQNVDYIIVGAGSAGCLLANRLSANSSDKVLLLEAGGKDKHPNIHIPAAFSKLFRQKEDWNFDTVPQQFMNGRSMFQPRGKVLGGSSSINAMIYIRGHQYDYDSWAALGNKGWSYEEVLPYFKKFEENLHFQDAYHGTDGELTVCDHRWRHPLSSTFLEAAQEAGYPLTSDFNGAQQEGFTYYQVTQRDGKRCSAAVAFLNPVKHRSNLHIECNALVHRVLIEENKATGIVFEQAGKKQTIHANKEVILCAGAFGSPHLLLLSGIGDSMELKNHQIELKKHLPGVGKSLQDHLLGGVCYRSKRKDTLDTIEGFPQIFKHLWNYFIRKTGPFTSNVAEGGGFVRTKAGLAAPDIQYLFAAAYYIEHGFQNPKNENGFSLGPTLIAPNSRGEVRLSSANPRDKILVDPNYLSEEEDVQAMVRGYQIAQKILQQKAFDPYRGAIYLPDRELTSEDEIIHFARQYSETLYHPTSTCKMGSDPNGVEMAVVDEQLQVYGIGNLRVADASIMPIIVRGNTNAPSMMIAEKAAAMILETTERKKMQVEA